MGLTWQGEQGPERPRDADVDLFGLYEIVAQAVSDQAWAQLRQRLPSIIDTIQKNGYARNRALGVGSMFWHGAPPDVRDLLQSYNAACTAARLRPARKPPP